MANNNAKYKLKGHGSFVIREGWINKILYYVNEDNMLFREKKAADKLGVGNNMAQAIRYWAKACDLMSESTKDGARLTPLGKIILENDPYLEEIFTLWILHCQLIENKEIATSWYLFFNDCEVDEYTRDELLVQMKKKLDIYIKGKKFSEASLKDDIAAITNMYAKERDAHSDPEDNMISPFTALGLLKEKNHRYNKVQPNLNDLDDKVVLFVLLKQLQQEKVVTSEKSISIETLQNGKASVGKILNLSRVTLNQYLDRLENQKYIKVNRTAGLDMVYQVTDITPLEVVKEYYSNVID